MWGFAIWWLDFLPVRTTQQLTHVLLSHVLSVAHYNCFCLYFDQNWTLNTVLSPRQSAISLNARCYNDRLSRSSHSNTLLLLDSSIQNFASPLNQLQQRTWLMHWSLFIFFNHDNGRNGIIDLFFSERYHVVDAYYIWILVKVLYTCVVVSCLDCAYSQIWITVSQVLNILMTFFYLTKVSSFVSGI